MACVTPSSLNKGTPKIRTGSDKAMPTPAIAKRKMAGLFGKLQDLIFEEPMGGLSIFRQNTPGS
jgi:hypothetical protein